MADLEHAAVPDRAALLRMGLSNPQRLLSHLAPLKHRNVLWTLVGGLGITAAGAVVLVCAYLAGKEGGHTGGGGGSWGPGDVIPKYPYPYPYPNVTYPNPGVIPNITYPPGHRNISSFQGENLHTRELNLEGGDQQYKPEAIVAIRFGWWFVGMGIAVALSSAAMAYLGRTRFVNDPANSRAVLEKLPMNLERHGDARTGAVLATLHHLLTLDGNPRQAAHALGQDHEALMQLAGLFHADGYVAGPVLGRLTSAPNVTRLLTPSNHTVLSEEAKTEARRVIDEFEQSLPAANQALSTDEHRSAVYVLNQVFKPGGTLWYERRMQHLGRGTLNHAQPLEQGRALARAVLLDIGYPADRLDEAMAQVLPAQTGAQGVANDANQAT